MIHPAGPGPLDALGRDDVIRSPGQPMTASGQVIAVLRGARASADDTELNGRHPVVSVERDAVTQYLANS